MPPPNLTIGGAAPATNCDCFQVAALPECFGSIRLKTSALSAAITIYVEDKWGQCHTVGVTTNADGYALLDYGALPAALFNAHSGFFMVYASLGDPLSEWLYFDVDNQNYLCLMLHFANFGQEYGIVSI